MNKEKIIYIILFTAVFNAVLRISSESSLTAFRLLIPVSFILIYTISKKTFSFLIKGSILFLLLASLQNFITKEFFYPQVGTINYSHLFEYCIHYISIFVVVALVHCLRVINGEVFFIKLINYLSWLVKFILLIYIPYILTGHRPENFLVFGNINDLGCILTGGILVILFDTVTKKGFKFVYIFLLLSLLYYNDSKLAMFGGILEVFLYYILQFSKKVRDLKRTVSIVLISIGVVIVVSVFSSSFEINGYSVRNMVLGPYYQIVEGVYFPHSSQSFTFRTNNIVGIIEILKSSWGVGVGPGNTSLILKYLIPDPDGIIRQDYVASHIWWFEIMADLGWIVIIPMVRLYIKEWKQYLSMEKQGGKLFASIFFIAFPIWCMSSSGLYTEFYSIMLIALSLVVGINTKSAKILKSNE